MFKQYSGLETLQKDGFQVFQEPSFMDIIKMYPKDLENIVKDSKDSDVFRTKLGDIKQIQNLNFGDLNQMLAQLIHKDKEFKVLNNQYFCKPPHYKETSAHQDNAYFESDSEVYTFGYHYKMLMY